MTLLEVIAVSVCLLILGFAAYPLVAPRRGDYKRSANASNTRQIALAAIIYSGDYDDRIVPTINGRWSRLQDRGNSELTINCPGPGTQAEASLDSANGKPTRTWVHLIWPDLRSMGYLVRPEGKRLRDPYHYFEAWPRSVTSDNYAVGGATYRNQGRFPFYGINYMYLAPMRVPKEKLDDSNPLNYAESEPARFADANDPSGTVFFVGSQRSPKDPGRGYFVVNAPGGWPRFVANPQGYIAFWSGSPGSGDWFRGEFHPGHDDNHPERWNGFVCMSYNAGIDATFLDGHVKYMKDNALAAGTDYLSALPGGNGHVGSGAKLVHREDYLWDLR